MTTLAALAGFAVVMAAEADREERSLRSQGFAGFAVRRGHGADRGERSLRSQRSLRSPAPIACGRPGKHVEHRSIWRTTAGARTVLDVTRDRRSFGCASSRIEGSAEMRATCAGDRARIH
jgi:hypothetical protein